MHQPLPLVLCLEPNPTRFISIQDALFLRAQLLWVDDETKAVQALEAWGPSFAGVLVPTPNVSDQLHTTLVRFGLAASVHGVGDQCDPAALARCLTWETRHRG